MTGWTKAWGIGVAVAGLLIGATAGAHHAKEYLETEGTETVERGEGLVYLRYDFLSPDRDDVSLERWEITPGLAWGLTDRVTLDAHLHYAKFGEGHLAGEEGEPAARPPFFEAVAVTLQVRLTKDAPVNAAVSFFYEQPFRRARDLLDAAPVYGGTLILSRDFGHHANVTLNLTVAREGDETEAGYALGLRRALGADPHGISGGIEVVGSFEDVASSWMIVPGVYIPLDAGRTILKAGFGIGRSADETQATVMVMHAF